MALLCGILSKGKPLELRQVQHRNSNTPNGVAKASRALEFRLRRNSNLEILESRNLRQVMTGSRPKNLATPSSDWALSFEMIEMNHQNIETVPTKMTEHGPETCSPLTYSEQRAKDLANGIQYGLRAEYRGDCEPIVAVLKPWLLGWLESDGWLESGTFNDPNERYWASRNWGCDTDVKFVMRAGSPSLNEIRWLINSITDCHVAAQTVELIETYTGERMHYELFDETAVRPSKEIILASMESMTELQSIFEHRGERARETFEQLQAHVGNPEPYMREAAMQQAKYFIENGMVGGNIDSLTLAGILYKNMTFDSNGVHVSLPHK